MARPKAEPGDDAAAAFQENMLHLVRSLGLHKPDETPCGHPISVGEAHALLEIAREPGISQNGLVGRLRLEKSTVSRLATMLETRGWVRRLRDQVDGRVVRLHLTQRGIKANSEIAASRRAKFERIFTAVPAAHRRSVADALSLLLEATR